MSKGYSLDHARYKLMYRQAFGTAHGTRDGTDSVFIRLGSGGLFGYGEATLPPYVTETPDSVLSALRSADIQNYIAIYLEQGRATFADLKWSGSPAARAAFTMALMDLKSRLADTSVAELLGVPERTHRTATSVTLGLGPISDIPLRISELPQSNLIKVKLGGHEDIAILEAVQACDNRSLLLDANQGWNSIYDAQRVLEVVKPGRLIGLEQPFGKYDRELHAELQAQLEVPIYGDESIQGIDDMEKAVGHFQGVNIKLMKCGGLDRALEMIRKAEELGLKVMLGCMSESSLGCAAMAQLQPYAEIADLDGPWLIGNDPFQGLHLEPGGLWADGSSGLGVVPALSLDWTHIGA